MTNEIENLLLEDAREKAKARPRASVVTKKSPRRVVFPSDLIDKRKEPDYRSSRVVITKLMQDKEEMVDMATHNLPTFEELRKMPTDKQREILTPLAMEYTDREVAEMFGVETADITSRRQSLKIRKFSRDREKNDKVTSLPNIIGGDPRMVLTIKGEFTASDLKKRLEYLTSLMGDHAGKLNVDITIVENEQEKLDQAS